MHKSDGRITRRPTGRRPPRVAVAGRQVGAGESRRSGDVGREWALVPTGGHPIAPARGDHAVGHGAWLPDGKRIVFTRSRRPQRASTSGCRNGADAADHA